MNDDLKDKVLVVIGVFVITSFGAGYFYGWPSIITCAIGHVIFAVIFNRIHGGAPNR